MPELHDLRPDILDFHRRREAQERKRSEQATNPIVRRLHLDLANRHAEVVRSGLPPTLAIACDIDG